MDLAELQAIADKVRAARKPIRIRCCVAAGCLSANAQLVKQHLEAAITATGLDDSVEVCGVGCMRLCSQGPLVQVDPAGTLYQNVTPEHGPAIVAALDSPGDDGLPACVDTELPFFIRQRSIVLENSGQIDPERIESYIAAGGYQALYHVLHEMTSAEVIDAVTRSGLRGRGGAGYPTGLKWAT